MTTETVLTLEQIDDAQESAFNKLQSEGHNGGMGGFQWDRASARPIEQTVLQSPEIQRLREDAGRYRWLKQRMLCVDFEYGEPSRIALVFEMPDRDTVFSADCDANVDLGMEQQP